MKEYNKSDLLNDIECINDIIDSIKTFGKNFLDKNCHDEIMIIKYHLSYLYENIKKGEIK